MAQSSRSGLAWLRESAASSHLFRSDKQTLGTSQTQGQRDSSDDGTHYMPMAARGNELFVVVDNEIRWADLLRLREESEESMRKSRKGKQQQHAEEHETPAYKTLKFKQHEQIRELNVSPNEEIMAVVTEHNVTIILLPDPANLSSADTKPVRVKTHTIGPTTHVTSQSAVAKVLWHPLGIDKNCLVTITASSVVRLWELDRRNLSSFSEPSVSLDLKKLRYAKSQDGQFRAGDMTKNRTFSTDDGEMEVTAACFGANGGEAVAFDWSAATLWLTMAEGDVFALCPLLPTRFEPDDDGTVSTLYELSVAQKDALEAQSGFEAEKARAQAKLAWLHELHDQYEDHESYDGPAHEPRRIYSCPRSQGLAPRLQGPFVIIPNDIQDDLAPCDIHVIGATAAARVLNTFGEDAVPSDQDIDELGTSFSTVCILSTDGRVHVCIDVDGVEPEWLPRKGAYHGTVQKDEKSRAELLLFEALDTLLPEDSEYGRLPVFTPSTDADEYKFYVTNSRGIYEFSVEPWVHDLEAEMLNSGTAGVKFRTQVLSRGPGTTRERIFRMETALASSIATPVVFGTEDLGRLLLTVQADQPYAIAFLDPDVDEEPAQLTWKPGTDVGGRGHIKEVTVDRDVYVPSTAFAARTEMASFVEKQVDPRQHRLLKEEVRLSPATLSVMTEAHRVLSRETTALNNAAAELFRRCERLHDEFQHQIQRTAELAARVREFNDTTQPGVASGDDGNISRTDSAGDIAKGKAKNRSETVHRRLQEARERNEKLLARHDDLKRRLAHARGRPLSSKEKAWMVEVRKVRQVAGGQLLSTDSSEKTSSDSTIQANGSSLVDRYEEVRNLTRELLEQVKEREATAPNFGLNGSAGSNGGTKVPPDIRRQKMTQVQDLMDRETALVEAALDRLSRLGLAEEEDI